MPSNIRGSDNMDSANVELGRAKAFVNFDASGVVAIRDSFNVSSITDNTVGDFTANFTNNMANENYTVNITSEANNGSSVPMCAVKQEAQILVGSVRIQSFSWNGSSGSGSVSYDSPYIGVSIFGDLA